MYNTRKGVEFFIVLTLMSVLPHAKRVVDFPQVQVFVQKAAGREGLRGHRQERRNCRLLCGKRPRCGARRRLDTGTTKVGTRLRMLGGTFLAVRAFVPFPVCGIQLKCGVQ